MNGKPNDVMNVDDLADYLRLPKTTIYRLVQRGNIPGKKAGRQWRFHKGAIDMWLSTQSNKGNEALKY